MKPSLQFALKPSDTFFKLPRKIPQRFNVILNDQKFQIAADIITVKRDEYFMHFVSPCNDFVLEPFGYELKVITPELPPHYI